MKFCPVPARVVEHRDHLSGRDHAGFDDAAIARRRFREEIDLAALQRQPRRRARAIAGHVFVGDAQHVEGDPHADVLRGVDAQAAADQAGRLDDVGRLLHAGRHVGAHEVDGGAGLRRDELVGLEVDAEALGVERIDEGGAGEVAGHGAVARRHLAHVLGADDAAGTVHVLDHDVGRAVDVAHQVFGEHPRLDVGRSAGGGVDQDGEPPALVEGIIGVRRGGGEHEQGAKRDDGAHEAPRVPAERALARREPGTHMWTAPDLQELGSSADRIACDHMSGLLMRSHMTAAKMGSATRVPNSAAVSSVPLGPTECLASGIDRSHHLLRLEQAPASARGDGRSHAELVMRWSSRSSPETCCAMRARGAARSPREAQRRAPRGPQLASMRAGL